MKVLSESDNKVEINPYWSKIDIDELQKLGNLMEFSLSDMDSMPDLVSISGSEASQESVIFILTPLNSTCSIGSENDSFLSDEEMTNLTVDEGEDRLTTFDTVMLINVRSKFQMG